MADRISDAELEQKVNEVYKFNIDGQAKFFLKQFVMDFFGKFEEVLDLAEEFKKFDENSDQILDEFEGLRFLESRAKPMTFVSFRENFRSIDINKSRSIRFIEWALFLYKRSWKELFFPPGGASPELIAAMEKAVEDFQSVVEKRKAREEKMRQLENNAKQGGVKGNAAGNELAQMKSQDSTEANRELITKEAAKKRLIKAVENAKTVPDATRQEALKKEEARLKAEEEKKKREEEQQKQASRQRLADKAKLWEQK
jgi:hypothetical protein